MVQLIVILKTTTKMTIIDNTLLKDIKQLIANGRQYCFTHSLFSSMDSEVIDLLDMENYTLILDEVMGAIEQVDISRDDLRMLTENEVIEVDSKGVVRLEAIRL